MALLRGGCKSQAAIFGAGAIANLVSHNGINQDAAADSGAVEAVIELLSAALEAFPDGMQDATQAEYRYISKPSGLMPQCIPHYIL